MVFLPTPLDERGGAGKELSESRAFTFRVPTDREQTVPPTQELTNALYRDEVFAPAG